VRHANRLPAANEEHLDNRPVAGRRIGCEPLVVGGDDAPNSVPIHPVSVLERPGHGAGRADPGADLDATDREKFLLSAFYSIPGAPTLS